MDENMQNHDLSIQDFSSQERGFQETSSGSKVVLLEKLEKLFKCTEKKSLTITTIMKVERALKELKVRSNRKNYESSNASDLNDTDASSGSNGVGDSSAAHHHEKKSSIAITTKRSLLYERRSRSRKTDDKFITNESSNESFSEQMNKVERSHYHENKRERFEENSPNCSPRHKDRCSPFTRYDRSPRYEDRAKARCEDRPRYEDSERSRCEDRPRYDDRDRSSRNKDRRSPSTQYDYRHCSPRYEDRARSRYDDRGRSPRCEGRRSRSRSRFQRHEKRKMDRKTARNRNEHEDKNNTRYSCSDPWEEEDRNIASSTQNRASSTQNRTSSTQKIGVAGSTDNHLMPENDLKDFLPTKPPPPLLRTRTHSAISPIIEEKAYSNGEHTSQNSTDVRSQLSTFIKSHLKQNDKPTSTQTSNEYYEQNSTNDSSFLDSIANEEIRKYNAEFDIDNEIINQIVAQSVNTKDKSSNNVPTQLTFDVGTVKQALATVQMNEKRAFNVNPEAQTQGNSSVTPPHYCPMSQCISCACPKPTPKESLMSTPSSVLLPAPQPVILSASQDPRPRLDTRPPSEPRPSLDPRPVPQASLNSYRLQSYQPGELTRPIQRISPNPFNSSPGDHFSYQASAFPEQNRNSAIATRRPKTFYEKRAPMTYGAYKGQNTTVPSTSGSVHNNTVTRPSTTVKSNPGVYRSNNNSMPLPKVIPRSLELNFKIPKIPRTKDASNKIHIIENWDLTPESVKKQLNLNENSELQDNLNGIENSSEDDWDLTPESVENQSNLKQTEPQDNNGIENGSSEDSLSVDRQFTGASAEPVLKDLINPNNLLALVHIMGKLSDNNNFAKIKEMFGKCESASNQKPSENVATNLENSGVSKPTKKKYKNELDRLNDDINTMFIRDEVLSANGRRVSSQCKIPNTTYVHATSKSCDVISKEKQKSESTPPISHMDISLSYKHSAESLNIQRSKSTPLQTRKPTKQVEKLVKKSANAANNNIKQRKATNEADKSIKKRVIPSEVKDGNKGKRPRGIVDAEESQPKKAKVLPLPVMPQLSVIKNNNTEWHSLKKVINCKHCDKPYGISLVSHYLNVHPSSEVIVSRLPPEVLKCVFDSTLIEKCEVIKRPWYGVTLYEYKQFCFFCNVYYTLGKNSWIRHMSLHTGYYQFRCVDCNRKFSSKPNFHKVKEGHKIEKISLPQFKKPVLNGYICKLCNFVRFDKSEIKAHLTNEHEDEHNIAKMFKEILFLSFVKKKKHEIAKDESESEDYESDSEDYGSESEKEHEKELEELYKESLEEETEEECESDEDYDSTEFDYAKEEGFQGF